MSRFEVAVVGAGCFGAWCAWHLTRAGRRVALLDAYGPGNSRASSGGETRIIRMGYGKDEVYTRSSLRSLDLWKAFFRETAQPLFVPTGGAARKPGHEPRRPAVRRGVRLRLRALAPQGLPRPPGKPDIPHPAGGVLLRHAGGR